MHNCFLYNTQDNAIAIIPICQSDFTKWLEMQPIRIKNCISINRFSAKPHSFCFITDQNGNLEKVLIGIENNNDSLAFGALPKILPAGCYSIEAASFTAEQLKHAAIGWGMGSYQFSNYKKSAAICAKLLCSESYDIKTIDEVVSSISLVRDLINMPACDLYPEKLANIAENIAKECNAEFRKISGDELCKNFPAVYAVGRGSQNPPALLDLRFGNAHDPKIVLVGKGVCFDSGGLQLKTSTGMLLMKKDMAGAAHVLGLARMIMHAKLPINLRVIIPAVENLISGDSLKPGDIITTRKGLTIEITSTDAEGRLILADALAFACEDKPEMILDLATLTSAAGIALGPNIVALFSSNDQLAQDIITAMIKENEPVWNMPLYQPYLKFLKSEIADFKNASTDINSGAGAITAALFLQQFVSPETKWIHFDMAAYNTESTAGKPAGGEAMCLQGIFSYLKEKYLQTIK